MVITTMPTQKKKKYIPANIEGKWQKDWEKKKLYNAPQESDKPKYYPLLEFPYPSGDGLHVGHLRPYTGMDIVARKRRMQGYNVLFPMGWDAFGLPAENYAVKTGIHPAVVTKQNIANFKRQMKMVGYSFDWDREISTADPEYYKWTQWIFLQLFKNGLAYKARMPINWCPQCKIGLANEEVVAGKCERCGTPVERKEKEQWMLRITAYAEKLLDGLENVDYLPQIKTQQVNWIGKKKGINITYSIEETDETVTCFTTRPDTNFGATFIVIGPEHPLATTLPTAEHKKEVEAYVKKSARRSEQDRMAEGKEKTGVFTGRYAVNNLNNERMPLWVADYVLGNVGTGAVVGVPGHDKRDFEFAKQFGIPVKRVVVASDGDTTPIERIEQVQEKEGTMVSSGFLDGLDIHAATIAIMNHLEKKGWGKRVTTYKLRDWVFSRQRYWGEPIPMIYCAACGYVPVPESDLPVVLPKVKEFKPRDDGESPLASATKWVNVKCPQCKGQAKRETDVMPNWAGSSWYFLRYIDPKNKKTFAEFSKLQYWMPVDWYNGGMEHVTLHLLYSRFWNIFLHDQKLVPVSEPYRKRTTHGFILAPDGRKMSKSLGNVINPDEVVRQYGADTLRVYEMFMGPFDQAISWNPNSIEGVHRFLKRIWTIAEEKHISADTQNADLYRLIHKTIKQVDEDIEEMGFNTMVSALMIFVNEASKADAIPLDIWKNFLRILAPIAPHLADELWSRLPGSRHSINLEAWPVADTNALTSDTFTLIIQVNGKVRDRVDVASDITEDEAKKTALERERVRAFLGKAVPARVIYVPGRLVNIVV